MKTIPNHPLVFLSLLLILQVEGGAHAAHANDKGKTPDIGAVLKMLPQKETRVGPGTGIRCAAGHATLVEQYRAYPGMRINQTFENAIQNKHEISRASIAIANPTEKLFQNSYHTPRNATFDLASLTKPIATATAIMRMKQKKRLKLSDPISKYLPEFAGLDITIDDLLRHRAAIDELQGEQLQYASALPLSDRQRFATRLIAENTRKKGPTLPPHTYRDSNFFLLSEIIRRIENKRSKKSDPRAYEKFVRREVLKPLRMDQTDFRKKPEDPLSRALQGSAGNAGLFSTTGDLEKFAKMMLANGKGPTGETFLSPESIREMTTPRKDDYDRYVRLARKRNITKRNYHNRNITDRPALRGAGFDLDNYRLNASGMGEIVERFEDFKTQGSFGHMGSTGTSLLIDRQKNTYVIVLAQKDRSDVINGLRVAAASAAADLASLDAEKKRIVATTGGCEAGISDETKKRFDERYPALQNPSARTKRAK